MTINYKKAEVFGSFKVLGILILFTAVMHNIIMYYPSLLNSVLRSLQIIQKTVLCVIFPYMIAAQIMCSADICSFIPDFLKKIYTKAFNTSSQTLTAFVMGNLCGYPIGAKILCELYKDNKISRNEAEHMLSWCTNSSPAFVIGTIGAVIFANVRTGIVLFAVQILSTIVCAVFLAPNKHTEHINTSIKKTKPFAEILSDSCISVIEISGTVLIFNLFSEMIKNTVNLFGVSYAISKIISTALCCILEITNGVMSLGEYPYGIPVAAAFAAVNCWSGISVLIQIKMILHTTDIKCGIYIKQKIIQSAVAAVMMYIAASVCF